MYDLILSICLRVESCAILELGSHLVPQSHPKMTKEFGVTVQINGLWNLMQSHHLLEVQLGRMNSIISFVARDGMSHL